MCPLRVATRVETETVDRDGRQRQETEVNVFVSGGVMCAETKAYWDIDHYLISIALSVVGDIRVLEIFGLCNGKLYYQLY